MAISKKTKQIVYAHISGMKSRYNKLAEDKANLQNQIVSITARMAVIEAEYKSLEKDIPKPEPEPEGV